MSRRKERGELVQVSSDALVIGGTVSAEYDRLQQPFFRPKHLALGIHINAGYR